MPLCDSRADHTPPADRPIRVVHVLEATEGGTRRWLENVLKGLDPRRVENACICAVRRDPSFGDTVETLRKRGMNVWLVDMRRRPSPVADVAAARRIAGILKHARVDIVHAHSAKAGMLVRIAARWVGVRPVVYSPHAFPFLAKGVMAPAYYAAEKTARALTDRLLAVSPSEAGIAVRLGYRPEQVVTVCNGVDVPATSGEAPDNKARPLCVGTVGSLRPQKNPMAFIDACALLRREREDVRFVMCGGGPLLRKARRRAERTGLGTSIEFAGPVDDVPGRLATFDVFVVCSHYEGLSYALLDAMAAGKPIVGPRVPGIEDVIVHEETGLLVSPGNVVALANAVKRLLNDRPLAHRLGSAARQRVAERYSLASQLVGLTAFYESVFMEFHGASDAKTCS